jgi:cyclopropane fatty-acyl-phospholipid synthase-like methyltransferase
MIRRLFFELRYLLGFAPWDTGISPPELLRFIDTHPPGHSLDIGCGTGTNAITLAENSWQVTGIDFSSQAIARARRKARGKDLAVEFIQGDVTALESLTGPYDLCLDIGCYHSLSLSLRASLVDYLSKLLHSGGTYLVYTFLSPDDEDNPAWPTEESLRRLFSGRFEFASVEHGSHQRRASAWLSLRRKG